MKRTTMAWSIAVAVIVVGLALFGLRQFLLDELRATGGQTALKRAEFQMQRVKSVELSGVPTRTDKSNPRTATMIAQLRALYQRADLSAATLTAVESSDPALWAQSLQLGMLCFDTRFAPPIMEDTFRYDKDKTGSERIDAMNRLNEYRNSPPLRLALPQPFAAIFNTAIAQGLQSLDPELGKAMQDAMYAPLSPADSTARDKILTETREVCASFKIQPFFRAWGAAQDRWVAQGATSALLKNKKAGWKSENWAALEDADFELVDRLVRERQPDGLARLLGPQLSFTLELAAETSQLDNSAMMASLTVSRIVAALASCELGVDDCSSDSLRFKELCVSFGGCHLESVPEQVRYVLARDGFDPQWLDQETERVVRAIREGNLDALGIRRKRDGK